MKARWPLLVLLAVCSVALIFANYLHVGSTAATGELDAEHFTIESSRSQPFLKYALVSVLELKGVDHVTCDSSCKEKPYSSFRGDIRIAAGSRESSISLSGVALSPGDSISLARTEQGFEFDIQPITKAPKPLVVSAQGVIKVAAAGTMQSIRCAAPCEFKIFFEDDKEIGVQLSSVEPLPFASNMGFKRLNFDRNQESLIAGRRFPAISSGIVNGKVTIRDVSSTPTIIAWGEGLEVKSSDEIELSVTSNDRWLSVRFAGNASDMNLRNGVSERTLMPTRLEFILAEHPVWKICASIGTLMTFLLLIEQFVKGKSS